MASKPVLSYSALANTLLLVVQMPLHILMFFPKQKEKNMKAGTGRSFRPFCTPGQTSDPAEEVAIELTPKKYSVNAC